MAYIEKESLCAWLEHMGVSAYIIDTIKNEEHFPTADVEEVKHAHWIEEGGKVPECSNCKKIFERKGDYCIHCGAKMDGGKANGR